MPKRLVLAVTLRKGSFPKANGVHAGGGATLTNADAVIPLGQPRTRAVDHTHRRPRASVLLAAGSALRTRRKAYVRPRERS